MAAQGSWKDYMLSVGPEAVVEFRSGASPKGREFLRSGPLEFPLGQELDQPWPMRVTCKEKPGEGDTQPRAK